MVELKPMVERELELELGFGVKAVDESSGRVNEPSISLTIRPARLDLTNDLVI